MDDSNLQHIILALLGVTGIEIIHDVNIQEWSKILLQAIITAVTLYKVVKRDKNKEE